MTKRLSLFLYVATISSYCFCCSERHCPQLYTQTVLRYYNREAVVISALQVEKHPITTPGPLTMSPSAVRLQKGAPGLHSALQLAKGMSGSIPGSSHYSPMTGTPHGEGPYPLSNDLFYLFLKRSFILFIIYLDSKEFYTR